MSRNRIYILVIVGLLLINAILLVFVLVNKPKPFQRNSDSSEGPKAYIIKKLELNNEQIEDYELLIQEHREGVNAIDNKIRKSKKQLYKLLNVNDSELKKDSLLNQITTYQLLAEKLHFDHFISLKPM